MNRRRSSEMTWPSRRPFSARSRGGSSCGRFGTGRCVAHGCSECTASTSASTLASGVCGRIPWPRFTMCPRAAGREQLVRRGAGRGGARGEDRGLEVALDRALRIAALHIGEIDAPIDAEHLGRQARVGVDQVRRVLQEQNPRDFRPSRRPRAASSSAAESASPSSRSDKSPAHESKICTASAPASACARKSAMQIREPRKQLSSSSGSAAANARNVGNSFVPLPSTR